MSEMIELTKRVDNLEAIVQELAKEISTLRRKVSSITARY